MAVSKVSVVLDTKDAKKKVVKYSTTEDGALSSAYVSNDAVKKLGNPDAIKVTIEAA